MTNLEREKAEEKLGELRFFFEKILSVPSSGNDIQLSSYLVEAQERRFVQSMIDFIDGAESLPPVKEVIAQTLH